MFFSVMVIAEISITPIGTGQTGVSFYVAQALDAVGEMKNVKAELNPMGTVLESDDLDNIFDAADKMLQAVHNLGVDRVGVILKID